MSNAQPTICPRHWDFEIETDHLISARRPNLIITNKKTKIIFKIFDFTVSADHRIKLKNVKRWIST